MSSQCMWWAGKWAERSDGSRHEDISATTRLCTSSPVEQAGPVCLLNVQYSSLSLFITEQTGFCEIICPHKQTDDLKLGYIKYSTEATCFQQGHSTKNTPTQAANGNPTDYRRLSTTSNFQQPFILSRSLISAAINMPRSTCQRGRLHTGRVRYSWHWWQCRLLNPFTSLNVVLASKQGHCLLPRCRFLLHSHTASVTTRWMWWWTLGHLCSQKEVVGVLVGTDIQITYSRKSPQQQQQPRAE